MRHDIRKSVWDAMEACQAIQEFSAGHTLETYLVNLRDRRAIEREFGILGEAFKRIEDVDPSFRSRFSEMGDAIGMRNRLAHGYDQVDDATVFDVVKTNVPPLLEKLEAWLRENG